MPPCLHLLNAYLPVTETFIWQYLKAAKRFPPLVLAQEWENPERFPLPGDPYLRCPVGKSRPAALLAALRGRYAQVSYRGCSELIRARGPAVVHAHYGYRAAVSLGLLRDLGLPFFTNFYGFDLSRRRFLARVRRDYERLFRLGEGFFVEGPRMRERLAALGCPADRIHIKRIAVIPGEYRFRERSWDGKRPVRLLFVGRLVEKKGLDLALTALAGLPRDTAWTLTIVGGGPERPRLIRQAARLGLDGRLNWAGYVAPADLKKVLESHDVLLQPSRTARDGDGEGGAPTVLLEAQACGLPVVASDHDDIPYVVRPGESALLFPQGDAGALRASLTEMLAGHARWPAMGRAGRAHVEAAHDVRREIDGLEEIYAAACEERRRQGATEK